MDISNEFPLYMGFGKLNPISISEHEGIVSCDYFFNGKPVHRITHNTINGRWKIVDIYNNTGSITSAKELKEGVMRHFNNLNSKTSSIFHFFRDSICRIGNIYFQNLSTMEDEGGVVSYYPAGRLVILRLPIFYDEIGQESANILINGIPYIEAEKRPLLKLCEAYNTSILLTKTSGEVSVIPVLMLEYIVTLASVLDAVIWMVNNNLIVRDKVYRMIIQEAKSKNQHSLQSTEETANKDYAIQTIIFKGFDDSKILFEEFHESIVEKFEI